MFLIWKMLEIAFLQRRSQYQAEVTKSKLDQIKITTLLKQILNIRVNIGIQDDSLKSQDIESDIALIKEFFEIDAIESYGSVPALRQSLFDLEKLEETIRSLELDTWRDIQRWRKMPDKLKM